jgi:peroxiredoxin
MRTAALVLAAAIAFAPPAFAQSEGKTPPPSSSGQNPSGTSTPQARARMFGQVYVGDRAPDFTLDGSDGKMVRPSRFRGDWVVIVFADRKEKLGPLATIHDELRTLGVQIVGVCKEKAHGLHAYATRQKLPFVLGADWTGEVSAMYGLYDSQDTRITPGFVLADRDGIVRMALQGHNLPFGQIAALVRYSVTGI